MLIRQLSRRSAVNVKVQQFRQHLLHISEEKISIPAEELLTECQKQGAASTLEEADRICRSLDSAGVVLRLANQVYLRPEDVAEQVIQAVPNTEAEIKAKLDHLKAEIEPLDKVKHHVDMRIHRRTKFVIWLALGAFLVQWLIFLRLTFWELSWDVMEPVTYFTSSLFGICTYTYFIGTNREFGYKDATSHLRSRWEEREYRTLRLDPSRYQQLVKDIHRYQRYLAAKAAH
ncbi:hypothetical protein WJX74_001601 [Apatococcus lobatus]|uniref:Calcium uniporter protein C-terminal domain-containing protein n=1 Tax=Apatococcus lobatus TaxID=904363 RepID=A0AAW1QJN5_9CHLO